MTIRASTLMTPLPVSGSEAGGFGDATRWLASQFAACREERADTGRRVEARMELSEAFRIAAEAGWDGPGTEAMSLAAFVRGSGFLATLPFAFPSPSIAAAPDGSVAMEWTGPEDRSLTVLIDAGPLVSMAWLRSMERGYAWARVDDGMPDDVLTQLRKTFD